MEEPHHLVEFCQRSTPWTFALAPAVHALFCLLIFLNFAFLNFHLRNLNAFSAIIPTTSLKMALNEGMRILPKISSLALRVIPSQFVPPLSPIQTIIVSQQGDLLKSQRSVQSINLLLRHPTYYPLLPPIFLYPPALMTHNIPLRHKLSSHVRTLIICT